MVKVLMEEDDVIDALVERVRFWKEDDDVIELYREYYDGLVNGGCFDGCELDVMEIVDNDVVNWLDVITSEEFDNYNIEDENDESIVAKYKDLFLVRC